MKRTFSILFLSLHFGLIVLEVYSQQPGSSNPSCARPPDGLTVLKQYSLLEQVANSPTFEYMYPNTSNVAIFDSGCDTYASIDGNNTFLNFRVGVFSNGSMLVQKFLAREIKPGIVELAGFTNYTKGSSRVSFEYLFGLACPNQTGTILAVYHTYCYNSVVTDEPAFSTRSFVPQPPPSCVDQINNTVISVANSIGVSAPNLVKPRNSRPYMCVTKYNGVKTINSHLVRKENSLEL